MPSIQPKNKIPYLIISIVWSMATLSGIAQSDYSSNGLRFKLFQIQDGLPSNKFNCFLQDSRGLIWLGTRYGIIWYDGYDFIPFVAKGKAIETLENASISALFEDKHQNVWIGTHNHGLFQYSLNSSLLTHYPLGEVRANEGNITGISEDMVGAICATSRKGFHRLIFPKNKQESSPQFISYPPVTFPPQLFPLIDSLAQEEKDVGKILFFKDKAKHQASIHINKATKVLVLAAGLKKCGTPSNFEHWIGIKDSNGQPIWEMSISKSYYTSLLRHRIEAGVIQLEQGTYELEFQYTENAYNQTPELIQKYLGIQVFELTDAQAIQIQKELAQQSPELSLLEAYSNAVTTDTMGNTWIVGRGGLTKMTVPNIETPEKVLFKHYFCSTQEEGSIRSSHAKNFYPDPQHGFWIIGNTYQENGFWGEIVLEHFNPTSEKFSAIKHGIPLLGTSCFYQDELGQFWIGNRTNRIGRKTGLFQIEQPFLEWQSKEAVKPLYFPLNPINLQYEARGINFIKKDFSGSLWIGTINEGLYQYIPEINRFRHFPLLLDSSDKVVVPQCFLEDKAGNIWIGTHAHGLFQFNPINQKIAHYMHQPYNNSSLTSNNIFDLEETAAGDLWVVSEKGVLHRMEKGEQTFTRFLLPDTLKYVDGSRLVPIIHDIEEGANGLLWIAAWHLGLYGFNTFTEQFEHRYFHSQDPYQGRGRSPNVLSKNSNGELIVGCNASYLFGETLLRITFPNTMDSSQYKLNPLTDQNYAFNQVLASPNGMIWGASNDGFYVIDEKSNTYQIFTEKDGLNSRQILAVTPNKTGGAWLLSPKGLTLFDPTKNTFSNYTRKDGVQIFATQKTQLLTTRSGQIVYGSRGSFGMFQPESLQPNPIAPKIMLTELFIANQRVTIDSQSVLKKNLHYTSKLDLSHFQNDLTFEYVGLHFQQPENNRYRYQLVGYEDNWVEAGQTKSAKYTNLPPGNYIFQVTAANSDGIWSEQAAKVELTIHPPWWQTDIAYLIFLAVALLALYILYRFLLNRQLEKAENQKLKELDAFKTQLYTNITHEFRTPLTIILGVTDQLSEKLKGYYQDSLNMIKRNGNQLLQLVNQMLDLNKLEAGKLELNLVQGDVITYLKYLTESFHSMAAAKNIDLHFENEIKGLIMDYDPVRLQQVMMNLLSNAVKFTPENGAIWVSPVLQNGTNPNNTLTIKVKDSGIGISPEKLPHIFDRFYQADDTHTRQGEGTGIGLALTKELIKLMQGTIEVESEIGQGTTFTVNLPIQKNATSVATTTAEQPILNTVTNEIAATTAPNVVANSNSSQKQAQLLIIEDNPDVTQYLSSTLVPDYQIITAPDGQAGIDKALEIIPDLIISDVMMPKKDGFEVCQTLKNDKRTSHIPIIMLTAKADFDSKMEGLERGADAYLPKPFERKELLLRIKKLLELRLRLQAHYLSKLGLSPKQEAKAVPSTISTLDVEQEAFLNKLKGLIDKNMGKSDFTVDDLARQMAMSRPQLFRKVKALTGISIKKLDTQIRMEKAKQLLQNDKLTITNIAYDLGYTDPNYFSKVFKKEFGVKPSVFREG